MGDDEDEESKTEDASPQRIEQAFEQGDLPMSTDLIAVASMSLGLAVLVALMPSLTAALMSTVRALEPLTRTQDPAQLFCACRSSGCSSLAPLVRSWRPSGRPAAGASPTSFPPTSAG